MESQNIDPQNTKVDTSDKASDFSPNNETLKVSNILMWCTVLFPLSLIPLEAFILKNDGNATGLIISIIPAILCISDRQLWIKHGKKIGNILWPVLIHPVYIWKRNNSLKQTQQFFWIWLGITVLSAIWAFYPLLTGGQSTLEKHACDLTTKIIREQFREPIKCMNAAIIESEGKTHYAIVELSNKNQIEISIREISGGRIYVEILD